MKKECLILTMVILLSAAMTHVHTLCFTLTDNKTVSFFKGQAQRLYRFMLGDWLNGMFGLMCSLANCRTSSMVLALEKVASRL